MTAPVTYAECREDCEDKIRVTPRAYATSAPGYACGISGGHCLPDRCPKTSSLAGNSEGEASDKIICGTCGETVSAGNNQHVDCGRDDCKRWAAEPTP